MNTSRMFSQVGQFFAEVRAAGEVAAAIEGGRKPSKASLKTLGLTESMFAGRE